jgi:6-pyruvoyltetrahydropterin/6-carboxytetrahydropterin synthase
MSGFSAPLSRDFTHQFYSDALATPTPHTGNAMPQVQLSRRATFSLGRRLFHPDWNDERNRAAFGRDFGPHGANYALELSFGGAISPEDGMIVNIAELKPLISGLIEPLDGAFLPEMLEHFRRNRPTAENLALYLWQEFPQHVVGATLARLQLEEARRTRIEKTTAHMTVSRSYEFAAAHRLALPDLDDAGNLDRFGICSNRAGHGHNFTLSVGVEGEPDAQTGYIISPLLLDRVVDEEIFPRFDHKHLNVDCPEFEGLVPTSENLALVIFGILDERLEREGFRLARVGLQETAKNGFEVTR